MPEINFADALIAFKDAINRVCEVASRMEGVAIPVELHPLVRDMHRFFAELDERFPKEKGDAWLQAMPMHGVMQ